MLCDPDGKVAICDLCGQLYSPYWSARKSKGLHESGLKNHHVRVMDAAEVFAEYGPLQTSEAPLA